jgi:hypothetical protein
LENIMGRTLHERVPLKGKFGFAHAAPAWTLLALAVAAGLFAVALHAVK